jgi:glycyl-tRNA synthetase beta chain
MDEFGVGRVVPVIMAKPANNRSELLLELLSEEIPARMQRRAIEEFAGLVRDKLMAAEIPAAGLRGYVTPRRLTIVADGIPKRQPDRSEERRGPRVGAPQNALDGFLRSTGLSSVEQCEARDTGRGEFYFAIVQHAGRPAAEVLPELLQAAIAELSWPKSMRFPAARLRWVRPLVSVLCLLDGEVLPLSLDEVPVGRTTRGHRFLSEGEIAVENAADYLDRLEAAYVILDQDRRRDIITADLDRLAQSEGLTVKPDPGLLDEVTGLVEFPALLIGAIDDASMALPPEVLATAMRTHQKYFSCLKPDGSLAPRFLFVANNLTPDDGKTIVAGNERVLRARLADARFFWDQDRKIRLEDRVEALKDRIYYEKLPSASVYDKAQRMAVLARRLASYVKDADPEKAARAAWLSKADLSTGMVAEFPELQGIMGRYYALHDGEDPCVADAIAEHYKPLGPNDTCPTAPDSVVVALADKIDALAAFFAIDEKPTGSRDPFALRRAAQGIIRLSLEDELRISLREAFSQALRPSWPGLARPSTWFSEDREPVDARIKSGHDEDLSAEIRDDLTVASLIDFVFDRLRVHVRDQGISHDLIAAAWNPRRNEFEQVSPAKQREDDLTRFIRRVRALQNFLRTDDGANLLVAYRRASNIVDIEERRDDRPYNDPVDTERFRQEEEERLYQLLMDASSALDTYLGHEEFDAAMRRLATLRGPVDEFFEKVTVNTDAEQGRLRENRLRLLSRIRAVMNQVADFSQIEG